MLNNNGGGGGIGQSSNSGDNIGVLLANHGGGPPAPTGSTASTSSQNTNTANANPRIRRRNNWFTNHHHNTITRSNSHDTDDLDRSGPRGGGKQKRLLSIADYQDGKRFSGALETTSILHDTTEAFQNVSARFGLAKHGNSKHATPRHKAMNQVRLKVGLYQNFPLANSILRGSDARETALRRSGHKQMNHVRGTDGWWRSMLVLEDRAMDNYLGPWIFILMNALFACLLTTVGRVDLPQDLLEHWDTVYSMVLKTSLAFLLVFRLNRCALRYWEARGYWGNLTHITRNLVGALLLYGSHAPQHRDSAIQWGSAFCVAAKNFIRSDHSYPADEFAGFLTPSQVARLKASNHPPLFAASMCRHHLSKVFNIDADTPLGVAHAHAIRLQDCEAHVQRLVEQVSGMEKIRSTPLPIAYVAHLRTFLFAYCLFLPYVWVSEWNWITIPLVAFTAFALLGIEGASSEVEIPFSRARSNHLALDAYCLVILDSVLGLVVHDANMHMQGRKKGSVAPNPNASSYFGEDSESEDDHNDDDDSEKEEDHDENDEELQRNGGGGGDITQRFSNGLGRARADAVIQRSSAVDASTPSSGSAHY